MTLVTFEEYKKLTPQQQGFVAYVEAAWPESELNKNNQDANPYLAGTAEHDDWARGNFQAMLNTQDGEE